MTDANQPGNMDTGQQQRRLKGRCPDLRRCALLPFACSELCWRLEPALIEAARVAGAKLPWPPERMTRNRAGKNTG